MARAAKSPEQFVAELAAVAPGIELLSPYVNARTKVSCRCRTCGTTWEATPNHLLRGSGCPACAGTERTDATSFAHRVVAMSPTVELLEPYANARTRVSCRCTVCGHEWRPYPKSLLQGHACPACAAQVAVERLTAKNAQANKSCNDQG
jgi:hypothetical protein